MELSAVLLNEHVLTFSEIEDSISTIFQEEISHDDHIIAREDTASTIPEPKQEVQKKFSEEEGRNLYLFPKKTSY